MWNGPIPSLSMGSGKMSLLRIPQAIAKRAWLEKIEK